MPLSACSAWSLESAAYNPTCRVCHAHRGVKLSTRLGNVQEMVAYVPKENALPAAALSVSMVNSES